MKSLFIFYAYFIICRVSRCSAQKFSYESIKMPFRNALLKEKYINEDELTENKSGVNFDAYADDLKVSENNNNNAAKDTPGSSSIAEQDLDASVKSFIDSAIKMSSDSNHEFTKALNAIRTSNETEAKDVWLAYGIMMQRYADSFYRYVMSSFDDLNNVSSDCSIAAMMLMSGLRQQKKWAIKFLDSFGARPSGLIEGSLTSLGAYDQCLSIHADSPIDRKLSIVGQYCVVKFKIKLPDRPKDLTLQTPVFNFTGTQIEETFLGELLHMAHVFYHKRARYGVCIPSACTKTDFEVLLKKVITGPVLSFSVHDCHIKESLHFNTLQTIILSVFAFIAFIAIVATSVDLIIRYRLNNLWEIKYISSILTFSLYTNGKQLFDTQSTKYSFRSTNGIKVLTMAYIVWSHTYFYSHEDTLSFSRQLLYDIEELPYQLLVNNTLLVDTFILVGAMIVTYHLLSLLKDTDFYVNILQLVFNHLFCLTPPICMAVLVMFVLPSLGSGPLWAEYFEAPVEKCYKYWWTTLTYINNWYDVNQMCLTHTYYLSADIQLYIVSIFFIILLYKKPKYGITAIGVTTLFSCVVISIRTYLLEQPPTILANAMSKRAVYEQMSKIYFHTYIHLGPYFVGIILAYVLFEKRTNKIKNKIANLVLCFWSMICCVTILLAKYPLNRGMKWSLMASAVFAGFHRLLWSIAVAWIIFICETGKGGPINTFLSWSFWMPLEKLCFMNYLLHYFVITFRNGYARQPIAFSHFNMFCEFIVNFVISTVLSIVAYLTFEAPFAAFHNQYLSELKILKWANIPLHESNDFEKAPSHHYIKKKKLSDASESVAKFSPKTHTKKLNL